jgi:hypothetical protein
VRILNPPSQKTSQEEENELRRLLGKVAEALEY